MSYSAVNIADDYYYRGVEAGETHRYSGQNLSYRERDAISYSTIIAKVVPAAGFKDCDVTTHDVDTAVTLVTMDPMSKTTAKHRNLVVAASPFRVICVPLDRGYGDFSPERLRDNFLNELASLKEFNHANVRRRFISVMNARNAGMSCACARWAKPLMSARFRKVDIRRQHHDQPGGTGLSRRRGDRVKGMGTWARHAQVHGRKVQRGEVRG